MKLIVLSCCLAMACAMPQFQREFSSDSNIKELDPLRQRDRDAQILSYENEYTVNGGNVNGFTADNGIERKETIELREVKIINDDGEEEIRTIPIFKGFFRYTLDNGEVVERHYETDVSGIRVEANDLPQPPVPVNV